MAMLGACAERLAALPLPAELRYGSRADGQVLQISDCTDATNHLVH